VRYQDEWLFVLDAVQRFPHPGKNLGADTVLAKVSAAAMCDNHEVNALGLDMVTVALYRENLSE